MPYKIALIDADQTLLDFKRSEHEALSDCLVSRGIPVTPLIIERYSKINDEHWKLLEAGKITREYLKISRFEKLFSEFGYTYDPESMADDYWNTLAEKSYLLDGAENFCAQLFGHVRMFIITNGTASVQKGRFNPSPIAPYFENCFISEEIGYAKPHVEYFNSVARMIPDFSPKETLVIGDSLTSDISGGNNANLDTCWFNPNRLPFREDIKPTYTASSFDEILRILLS